MNWPASSSPSPKTKRASAPATASSSTPYLYCGHCYPCRIGRTNCCTDLKVLGVHVDGGMAEYYCHPADMLIKIPDGMSWEEAAMAEPLTISLHGIHRGGLQAGEYCAHHRRGAHRPWWPAWWPRPTARTPSCWTWCRNAWISPSSLGIEYAVNSGAEDPVQRIAEITGGEMAHQVMECSGANAAVRQTPGPGQPTPGASRLTGWPKKETSLPTDVITKKGDRHPRGRAPAPGEFEEALELIRTQAGGHDDKILTRTVTMDEAPGHHRGHRSEPRQLHEGGLSASATEA